MSARDPRLSSRDPRTNRNVLPVSSVPRDHAAPPATLSVKPVAKIFANEMLQSLHPQSQPGTFSNENLCDRMSSSGIMSRVPVRASTEVKGPCNARATESRRDDRDSGKSESGIDCGTKEDERRDRKGGNANRHLSPRRNVSLQSKSEAQDRQKGPSRDRSHTRSRSPLHRNLRHFTRATASSLHNKANRSSLRSTPASIGSPHQGENVNTEVRKQGASSPSHLTSASVDRRHVGSAQDNSAGPSGVKGVSNRRRADKRPCRDVIGIGKSSGILPLSRGEKVDPLENTNHARGKGIRNRLQHRKVRGRCLEQDPSKEGPKEGPKEGQMAEAQFSPEPSGEDEPPPDTHPHKRFRRSAWEQVKGIRQGQENVPPGGRDPLSGMVRRASTQAVRIQHRPSFDPDVQIPKEMALSNKRDLLRKANQQLQSGSINEDQYLQMVHELNQIFRFQDEAEGRRRSTSDIHSIKSFPFPARKVYLPSLSTGIGFGSFQPRAGLKHFPYHCATPVISQGGSSLQHPVSDCPLLPDPSHGRDPRMECLRIGSEGGQSPREEGGNPGEVGLRTMPVGINSTDWKIHRGSPPFPGLDGPSLECRRVLLKTPGDESLGMQSGTLGEGRGIRTRSRSPVERLTDEVQVAHRATVGAAEHVGNFDEWSLCEVTNVMNLGFPNPGS
uniref:pre-mRNA cleavage complex 2 protein Pcf11-like n=1 Tax=Myxine glutinosa TaxID=7769 RepID=UPI00358E2EAE